MFLMASTDFESCIIGTRGTRGLLCCQDEMMLMVTSRRKTERPRLRVNPWSVAAPCLGPGVGETSGLPGLYVHLQSLSQAPSEHRTGRPW